MLAEFGDAPDRYVDARARRDYAGTAPITRASGTSHVVVARLARNKRLFDAAYQWALCALTRHRGARAYYDAHDPGPQTSKIARRKLANKLVGILHQGGGGGDAGRGGRAGRTGALGRATSTTESRLTP